MVDLCDNLFNLNLNYQIEDSNNFLDILYLELKIYKTKLIFLENEKPNIFQKKKWKKYNQEKLELESKIEKYNKKIQEELELIAKMENINN